MPRASGHNMCSLTLKHYYQAASFCKEAKHWRKILVCQKGQSPRKMNITSYRYGMWEHLGGLVRVTIPNNHPGVLSWINTLLTQTSNLDYFEADGQSAFFGWDAVESGTPVRIGQAKFIVQVPCSVKKAALGHSGGKPLRAIMEFGHGLFGNRGEVKEGFLSR